MPKKQIKNNAATIEVLQAQNKVYNILRRADLSQQELLFLRDLAHQMTSKNEPLWLAFNNLWRTGEEAK